ncbi:MAG: hypothetical protein ACTHM5_11800 [Ginsengibacter sp.]
MKEVALSTYIINLRNRRDRKAHILKEFEGRSEFNITVVEACEHHVGAIGLWQTINYILQKLANNKEEYIIICEDDHQFTNQYSKEILLSCLDEAQKKEADVLLGGVSSGLSICPVSKSLFWLEKFSGLQFTVLFRRFFKTILEADFGNNDAADYKISSLTTKKFFIYPFISIQKEFGYSDATVKNNAKGRVTELFNGASSTVQCLQEVVAFYQSIQRNIRKENERETFDNIIIPTYVITLPETTVRLEHIKKQFKERKEFDVTIVEAVEHEISAVGLWCTIRKIIQMALVNEDDVIIICKDGHEFSKFYSEKFLVRNIIEAYYHGADILCGGVASFNQAIPLTPNRLWIDSFVPIQFIILYKKFFIKILEEPFDNNVVPHELLSELTSNKMTLFPFISVEKDLGSANTSRKMNTCKISDSFYKASKRIERLTRVSDQYNLDRI